MSRTKRDWDEFRPTLYETLGRPLDVIKGSKLVPRYRKWNSESGQKKLQAVEQILNWFVSRKHKVSFAAIDMKRFQQLDDEDTRKQDLREVWNAAAFHIMLTLQSCFQKEKKNKGHTVFVFDRRKDSPEFFDLVKEPPIWSDDYYERDVKKDRLDQIVDVPFFADSKLLPLIQMADLMCYIVRRYAEVSDYVRRNENTDERKKYAAWISRIKPSLIARSHRYRTQNPSQTSRFFADLAPESLRKL